MATTDEVRKYWEQHIHDLDITRHPVGSRGFFDDLDHYHFEKLHHLLRLVDFDGYRGQKVLEVGCGAGVDLARFAKGGARVTGVDLAASAIDLAKANFSQQGLQGEFHVADGEHLPFDDNTFDVVYAHGVVQYTANPQRLVDECRRVLKPGGRADLSGLQPDLVAQRVVEADEGRARARRCAGAAQVQPRGVSSPALRLSGRSHRAGALSGEVAAARRLEGRALQRRLRGHVQRAPATAGAAIRLAFAGLLDQVA